MGSYVVPQPYDDDLNEIAKLATTVFGRSILTMADATAARALLGASQSFAVGVVGDPGQAVTKISFPAGAVTFGSGEAIVSAMGSAWRVVVGVPSNSLGVDGDFALDSATGNVYVRASGAYALSANIRGPIGTAGSNGKTILSGASPPADGVGTVGDFYLYQPVPSINILYGPKLSAGSWSGATTADLQGYSGYSAEMVVASNSTHTIGTGSKAFAYTAAVNVLGWQAGSRVRISANASNWMEGVVTSTSNNDVGITVAVDLVSGSGSFSAWNIAIAGERGAAGLPGSNGQGVPTGGLTGQLLAKASNADFDGVWVTPGGGGNVSNSGTPTSGQAAEWTGPTTIVGVAVTGTGSYVKATSPALVTPSLGVASATSINKVSITAPATGATLTIAEGATLTASATATVSGTNTGDETNASIKSKLGISVLSGSNTGDQDLSSYALKSYVDNAVVGVLRNKGGIDCSANPNYPAATNGDAYAVTVAGKIGGASGLSVDVGDLVVCSVTNAGGTQAAVGASWYVIEHNLVGALVAANNLSDLTNAATARSNLGLGTLATQSGTFSGTSSGVNTGDQTSVSGNAGTATALQTPRTINGVSFDGTANITIGCALGNVSGLGTGVATALAVNVGSAGAFVVVGGVLGTPSSGTLTNCTGLPIGSGVSGLGSGVATALAINVGVSGGVVTTGSNASFNSITISGNISAATWGTSGLRISGVPATLTDTSGAGTVAAAYTDAFGGNTIAATNLRTFTTYITAFFREAVAGSNVTFGTKFALGAESARFGSSAFASIDLAGRLTTPASTTSGAGLVVPHGTAPTSPVDGSFWSTTAGFFGRANGVTVGPFASSSGSGAAPQLAYYPLSNDYLTRRGTGATAAALVANRRFYQLVYVAETKTFTEITIVVTTGAASSSIRLGLRNCNQATGQPTTLIAETSTIDSSTTGLKQNVISQTLSPGWYILEITSNGTPSVGAYSSPDPTFGTEITAAGVNVIPTLFRDVAFGSLASDESGNTMARSSTGVIVGIR